MEILSLLLILLGISLPLGIYFWRENRYRNPASRWPVLAELMDFQYAGNPPRLRGEWKGRNVELTAQDTNAFLSTPIQCKGPVRLEIGPREEVEKAAGIVVPDRVSFGDTKFERNYMVRATPSQIGQEIDVALRQKLLALDHVSILATTKGIQISLPTPTETSQLRDVMDVAVSVADILDNRSWN